MGCSNSKKINIVREEIKYIEDNCQKEKEKIDTTFNYLLKVVCQRNPQHPQHI